MSNGKRYKWDKLIVFLIAFIPRLILIFCFAGVFRTPMDEMSTIATGAYFGGKDWTALTINAKFYYGGGFTILFAPLYRLIGDSVAVYYIMLSACAALQSISAPISYTVMEKYLKIENRKYLIVASLACSFMVVTRAMEVFNEHIVIGCVWLCVWILCKLVEDGKHKAAYSVALMLVFSYLLTTHARTKVIWIAFAMVVVIYRILYKKWLVSLVPAIISGIGGYFLAGRFNDMVKTVIWNWHEGEFLKNTNVRINISLSDLKDPVYWQGIFATIFGQVNTALIFTGGIAAIFIVVLVYFYCDNIKNWFITNILKRENQEITAIDGKEKDAMEKAGPYIMAISLTFLLCVGAVIAAQSITWLHRVAEALKESTYGTNAYGFKALTYVRYMGPFLGPLFLCGVSLVYHKKEELRKYLFPSCAAVLVLQGIWGGFILPHIYRSRNASEVFTAFGGYDIVKSTVPMGLKVYLPASIVLIIIFTICVICYYKKKILLPVLLALCLMGYEYAYGAIHWDGSYAESYGSRADTGAQIIKRIEADGQYRKELPKEIYVYDTNKGVQKKTYTYQIRLGDYAIIPGRPKDQEAHIVFCSVGDDKKLRNMGYISGQMDDNEYVYVNDPAYLEMFEAQGVKFQ